MWKLVMLKVIEENVYSYHLMKHMNNSFCKSYIC